MSSLLGPRWTSEELRAFYVLVKRQGQRQRKGFVEGRHVSKHPLLPPLPGRTPVMLRALYDMHRGYLSLAEASAEGFCAIMMDHYKSNPPMSPSIAGEDHAAATGLSIMEEEGADVSVETPSISAVKTAEDDEQAMAAGYNQSLKRDEHPTKAESKTKKRKTLDLILSRESSRSDDLLAVEGQTADGRQRVAKGGRRQHRLVWSAKIDRRWLTDPNASALSAKKFDLPWYYWFESVFDAEFFNENQFLQSLHQMDLGKITKAARPIWSSVRATMGRPRRFSPQFLAREKLKLDVFRSMKQQMIAQQQILSHGWQYGAPVRLTQDMVVVVRMEQPRGFLLGSIASISPEDGACFIKVANQPDAVFQSSLLGVMVLEQPREYQRQDPSSILDMRVQGIHISPKASCDGSASSSTSSKSMEKFREAKLRTLVLVRDLLQRKEQLIASLTKMNDRARQQTPSKTPSRRHHEWYVANDPEIFHQQHAWLSENLQVTNHSLRQAFMQLQQTISDESSEPINSYGSTSSVHTSTLSAQHAKWADDFVSASQERSHTILSKTMAQMEQVQKPLQPETKQLVVQCMSLMDILLRGSAHSNSIPLDMMQTLSNRLLEGIQPKHMANMDLYAELRATVDGLLQH